MSILTTDSAPLKISTKQQKENTTNKNSTTDAANALASKTKENKLLKETVAKLVAKSRSEEKNQQTPPVTNSDKVNLFSEEDGTKILGNAGDALRGLGSVLNVEIAKVIEAKLHDVRNAAPPNETGKPTYVVPANFRCEMAHKFMPKGATVMAKALLAEFGEAKNVGEDDNENIIVNAQGRAVHPTMRKHFFYCYLVFIMNNPGPTQ